MNVHVHLSDGDDKNTIMDYLVEVEYAMICVYRHKSNKRLKGAIAKPLRDLEHDLIDLLRYTYNIKYDNILDVCVARAFEKFEGDAR